MENRLPRSKAGMLILADSVANGASVHGEDLQLKSGTATAVKDAAALAQQAQENAEKSRDVLRALHAALESPMVETKDFARLLRELMRKILGAHYSEAWLLLGFRFSKAIPRSLAELESMIWQMWKFLAAHPEHEVAVKNITAAAAEALYLKLSSARKEMELQEAVAAGCQRDADEKFGLLRKRIRAVCDELKSLLSPLDTRWIAFGFNKPGAQATPEPPGNVVAMPVQENRIAVKWEAAPRANYYRVWKRVAGVDEEWIPVGHPADIDFLLEGLPVSAAVEIAVTAVNHGGESRLSAPAKMSLP